MAQAERIIQMLVCYAGYQKQLSICILRFKHLFINKLDNLITKRITSKNKATYKFKTKLSIVYIFMTQI